MAEKTVKGIAGVENMGIMSQLLSPFLPFEYDVKKEPSVATGEVDGSLYYRQQPGEYEYKGLTSPAIVSGGIDFFRNLIADPTGTAGGIASAVADEVKAFPERQLRTGMSGGEAFNPETGEIDRYDPLAVPLLQGVGTAASIARISDKSGTVLGNMGGLRSKSGQEKYDADFNKEKFSDFSLPELITAWTIDQTKVPRQEVANRIKNDPNAVAVSNQALDNLGYGETVPVYRFVMLKGGENVSEFSSEGLVSATLDPKKLKTNIDFMDKTNPVFTDTTQRIVRYDVPRDKVAGYLPAFSNQIEKNVNKAVKAKGIGQNEISGLKKVTDPAQHSKDLLNLQDEIIVDVSGLKPNFFSADQKPIDVRSIRASEILSMVSEGKIDPDEFFSEGKTVLNPFDFRDNPEAFEAAERKARQQFINEYSEFFNIKNLPKLLGGDKPQRFYHGSKTGFKEFDPDAEVTFVADRPSTAEYYTKFRDVYGRFPREAEGANIRPVYLKDANFFDVDNPEHLKQLRESNWYKGKKEELDDGFTYPGEGDFIDVVEAGNYDTIEDSGLVNWIKSQGFEGFTTYEQGGKNYGVFNVNNIVPGVAKKAKGGAVSPNFVSRIMDPKSPMTQDNAMVQLMDFSVDGRFFVAPTVFPVDSPVGPVLTKFSPDMAIRKAFNTGEFLEFDTEDQAREFAMKFTDVINVEDRPKQNLKKGIAQYIPYMQ